MNISDNEFKLIVCDIDGRDCCEYYSCSDCHVAIEYSEKLKITEFEEHIDLIDPRKGTQRSQKYKYAVNKDNTIAMYNSFDEFESDRFLPIDIYTHVNHGHSIKSWLYFPAWYELQHLLHLGIPDYYLHRDNNNPLIAVYPNAVYITAPRIDPGDAEEYGE